eukprot:CFRG2560T1
MPKLWKFSNKKGKEQEPESDSDNVERMHRSVSFPGNKKVDGFTRTTRADEEIVEKPSERTKSFTPKRALRYSRSSTTLSEARMLGYSRSDENIIPGMTVKCINTIIPEKIAEQTGTVKITARLSPSRSFLLRGRSFRKKSPTWSPETVTATQRAPSPDLELLYMSAKLNTEDTHEFEVQHRERWREKFMGRLSLKQNVRPPSTEYDTRMSPTVSTVTPSNKSYSILGWFKGEHTPNSASASETDCDTPVAPMLATGVNQIGRGALEANIPSTVHLNPIANHSNDFDEIFETEEPQDYCVRPQSESRSVDSKFVLSNLSNSSLKSKEQNTNTPEMEKQKVMVLMRDAFGCDDWDSFEELFDYSFNALRAGLEEELYLFYST